MFISLPLWQRPRVPLGWDQVSLGWTKGSAFGIRQDPRGPWTRSPPRRFFPSFTRETGRGRPVFERQQVARGVERRGKSCFWPSGALRGPDLRKFLQLPVYRTRVSCDNIGVWPAFLTGGQGKGMAGWKRFARRITPGCSCI